LGSPDVRPQRFVTPAAAEQPFRPGRVPLVEVVNTEPIDARAVPHLRSLLEEALARRPEGLVVDLAGCPWPGT